MTGCDRPMERRALLTAALLSACASAQPVAGHSGPDVLRTIFAAAGDSVLANAGGSRLYAADSATADALALAAPGAGIAVASAASPTWCHDEARSGRRVGIVVALRADSVWKGRALVRWSATCLMTRRGERVPIAFGEGGVYELVLRGERWRVSHAVARYDF